MNIYPNVMTALVSTKINSTNENNSVQQIMKYIVSKGSVVLTISVPLFVLAL